MSKTITIMMDYSGDSVSYEEGLQKFERGESFKTHCTKFFDNDFFKNGYDIVARWHDGGEITVSRVMSNDRFHTDKEMRKAHNLERMLLAGAFRKDYWRA